MNNKLKNNINKRPLVVDLDGTLIKTDMLHETSIAALRKHPTTLLKMPIWLLKGKAFLKSKLASLVDINPALLPYNKILLDWLKGEKSKGRSLVLSTATNIKFAKQIAAHVGVFDEVIASNDTANLAGENKADVLVEKFGMQGFDYVGNSKVDLHVWEKAKNAIVVNGSDSLVKIASTKADVVHSIARDKVTIKTLFKTFRVHQWLKNALIFMPILAAHQLSGNNTWASLLIAFLSFSLCASAVYIANDLLDLASDRQHDRKRHRPFASGALPIHIGVLFIPMLLISSFWLASYLNVDFSAWLLIYFLITCAYSLFIKKIVLIDCLTLAILYTLRILAGAAAAQITLSLWLLAFSIFLFFSLAFVKRYAELNGQKSNEGQAVHGRGYFAGDSSLIQVLGISSGHAALVVLALYLNSAVVVELYEEPKVIWATLPIMLFWISWVWLKAHRGEMHDDPLVFAIKDKASFIAGVMFAIVLFVGAKGFPVAVVNSWGRVIREEHNVHLLSNPLKTLGDDVDHFPGLAYGKGRSYGDVCLNPNGLLWKTEHLDNFIAFDLNSGVLTCQAGVTFQIINQTTINQGWMLPVTPGTKFLTLGGAIANDVHGKNHHKMGSIGHHVISLKLLRTDGTLIVCGPNENAEWFYATLGGLGLTGLIIEVSLQMRPVSSEWLDTESIAFDKLEDFYALSDDSEEKWEYTVAWIDCTNKKNVKGIFMRANHSEATYELPPIKKRSVPFALPFSLVNKLTLKPFNFMYYHLNALNQGEKASHYDGYFYPLDNIHNWNLIYGKKGFYQYQVAIPYENRVDAIDEMLKEISNSNLGSFLAVLKTFGDKESLGMMSFPMHGATLALDFSNLGHETAALFSRLDRIVENAHGRIYPAKDGRMPQSLFRKSYPRINDFLVYKDPGISSAFSRRVMEN